MGRRNAGRADVKPLPTMNTSGPLTGVVACLTGLTADRKEELHDLVERLGGRYTRELNTAKTTHLVAEAPSGDKYRTAVASGRVVVVAPSWLEACERAGRIVPVRPHVVGGRRRRSDVDRDDGEGKDDADDDDDDGGSNDEDDEGRRSIEEEAADLLCSSPSWRNALFSQCRFMFLGYDAETGGEMDDDDDVEKGGWKSLAEQRTKLSSLVRRCSGVIYWDLNETVTHLVVSDRCGDEMRNAIQKVTTHHPNGIAAVSPKWIVASVRRKRLLSPESYPPAPKRRRRRRATTTTPKRHRSDVAGGAGVPASSSRSKRATIKGGDFFRGDVFCFVRTTPSSSSGDAVEEDDDERRRVPFDVREMEAIATERGGHLLTRSVVETLEKHRRESRRGGDRPSEEGERRRTCYCVSWGGGAAKHRTAAEFHPLLSELLRKELCDVVVHATPVWIRTCATEGRKLDPRRHRSLFEPQRRPVRSLRSSSSSDGGGDGSIVKAAVTGFVGPERTGIVHLLSAIGARYTENLTRGNTHLICKDGTSGGPKYDKAIEWGLHVVSAGWLYHVAHDDGFGGGGVGCEEKFSLVTPEERRRRRRQRQRRQSPRGTAVGEDDHNEAEGADRRRNDRPSDATSRGVAAGEGGSGAAAAAAAADGEFRRTNDVSQPPASSDPFEASTDVSEHDLRLRSALKRLEAPVTAATALTRKRTSSSGGVGVVGSNGPPTRKRRRRGPRATSSSGGGDDGSTNSASAPGDNAADRDRCSIEERGDVDGDGEEGSPEEEDGSVPLLPPLLSRRKSVVDRAAGGEVGAGHVHGSQVVWYAERTQQH